MKKVVALTFCLSILISFKSQSQGISFENNSDWTTVLNKAKKEGKHIFIDCYTTWCGPCKKMDAEVYADSSVGTFMNEHFVSIKLQIDTSKNDTDLTKRWAKTASEIKKQFDISIFPTYLFMTADGAAIHKSAGYVPPSQFTTIAKNSLDPNKQYYTLLKSFKKGAINQNNLLYLVQLTKSLRDVEWAVKTAQYYFKTEFTNKNSTEILSKDNLNLISEFSYGVKTNSNIFRVFVTNSKVIDSIMNQNSYANDNIISWITNDYTREPIESAREKQSTPNWTNISQKIERNFNKEIATRIILTEKMNWHLSKKEYEKATDYFVEKINKCGLDTAGISWAYTNNLIWQLIFERSNDRSLLDKALKWVDTIRRQNPTTPSVIDTYANLLYKTGKTNEAIKWQMAAIKIEEDNAKSYNIKPSAQYKTTLDKMKQGEPTWPTNN